MKHLLLAAAPALLLLLVVSVRGQDASQVNPLTDVRLDQRIGERVPLDLIYRDEHSEPVKLEGFFGAVPVILIPVYYRCPMLCTQVLNALVRTMRQISLSAPNDFQVVIVSIDPREEPVLAAEKKMHYLDQYDRPGANDGWHFLTGSEDQIRALTDAIGFHYVYDAKQDQYAHPAAITIVSADGKINRYILGLDFSARDMRLALVDTAEGRIGSVVDQILLRCYHYDPSTGRYGFAIMTSLRVAAAITVFTMLGGIVFLARRYRQAPALGEMQA